MTTINPLFSVVTVTLNNLDSLQKTDDSLKQQSFTNYEWIVIDGNSHDGTQNYLKTTKANWLSEKDSGIYDAMNKGIDRAQGDYIIFMNAGDSFADKKILAILGSAIQTNNSPDFIYGDALEILNGHTVLKKSRSHRKINQGMFTHHQAMIYSRTLLDDREYDTAYSIAADYDLTLRLLKEVRKVTYLPHPICLFESGGISQQQVFQGRKEQFLIRQKQGIPLLKNGTVFIAQSLLYALRQNFPRLYWRLKH